MNGSKRLDRSRALILQAAHAAFLRSGVEGTSMEEIATLAGLTRKTLYNHFGSKEEIALALIAAVEADDLGFRARISAGENAVALIEHVLLQSARWCMANPSLARLALSPANRPTLTPPPGRPSFQRLVSDIIRLGQEQSLIRADRDADFMALVLLAVYGQAMLNVLAGEPFHKTRIRDLVHILIEGLAPQVG